MIEFIKDTIRRFRQQIFRKKVLQTNIYTLTNNSVVIIAPHPDDEAFGCAGLISMKAKQGVNVSIIFLSNGENSLEDVSRDEIISHRQHSAKKATEILGVKNIYFMNFSDGSIPRKNMPEYTICVEKIASFIKNIAPTEVFCTHRSEGWSDHTAAAEITTDALKKLHQNIALYYYWVWVWFSVPLKKINVLNFTSTFYLPIQNTMEDKLKVIDLYLSDVDENGRIYCGELPKMFLKAFEWPYEVFEKVEYK